MKSDTLKRGDRIVIKPQDDLDPDSLHYAGQSGTFLRYSQGIIGSIFVLVEFDQRVMRVFRKQDVLPQQQREEQVS